MLSMSGAAVQPQRILNQLNRRILPLKLFETINEKEILS